MRLATPSLFFLLPVLVRPQLLTSTTHPSTPAALSTPQPPSTPSNPITTPTSSPPTSPPTTPTIPTPSPLPPHELLRRLAAGVGAANGDSASSVASQEPAITSWDEWSSVPGSNTWTHVSFAYTQLFSAVPQQGPTATSGDVGMGSLTGVYGAERTDEARSAAGGRRGRGRVWVAGLVGVVVMGLI